MSRIDDNRGRAGLLPSLGEDGLQFFGRDNFKLSEVAGSWFAVGAPPAEVGHMPEASALHMLVRDLNYQFWTERLPGKILALAPAAFAAGHAMFAVDFFGAFPILPWVIAQGILAVGREEIEKRVARFRGEACADADVLQKLCVII